ncbi:hypothetical protein GJAV_G00089890 [Gymnothorax javanicus]|nr:hypothetical protein GJAV_G00089890 [Gymnothorax javanicus]
MPGGSTSERCPFCQGTMYCAQKICPHCQTELPKKQHLLKKLQKFDAKRGEWAKKTKLNHNISSVKDQAAVMVCTAFANHSVLIHKLEY